MIAKLIILIYLAFKVKGISDQDASTLYLSVKSNVIIHPNAYVF